MEGSANGHSIPVEETVAAVDLAFDLLLLEARQLAARYAKATALADELFGESIQLKRELATIDGADLDTLARAHLRAVKIAADAVAETITVIRPPDGLDDVSLEQTHMLMAPLRNAIRVLYMDTRGRNSTDT